MAECSSVKMGASGATRESEIGSAVAALFQVLRDAEAYAPVSASLGAVGAFLICIGASYGILNLLRAHPYILLVLAGLVFLIVAAVSCREGLLAFLPAEFRNFLLNTTLFDLWHNDTGFTNWYRRWGRVQLLCSGEGNLSEGEVAEVVDGLDPDWVEALMRRPLVQWLPPAVSRTLLPECSEATKAVKNKDMAILADSRDATSSRATSSKLSSAQLAAILREREEAKIKLITEPEIQPLLVSKLTGMSHQIVVRSSQAFAYTSAIGWGVAALVLHLSAPREWLGHFLTATSDIVAKTDIRTDTGRIGKAASALSLLSAGAAVAITVYARRRL
mmetsp:Transcript_30913/g.67737  ORF Transcript_30913/g.67737 Transcript_30913/m.67737 type:complete len:332 (-) Transcript_30913:64-1059(-)|eukprot:CAMPEP_0170621032 /NCGR_PEP_ID=MMETSP0224-20130122/28383_1 /TAXON_ID=285029 /ORGANISM="Togula jolla, Strain CCCM 725" /LENGTH=331 /DNA_ID=CAMNT_0010947261 /DNA_START=37 /DNA_END=1032 /DNA_ORIENTATION=-